MNIAKAKGIPIESLLTQLGFAPLYARKEGKELWYKSPFREEKTPSFKITIPFNSWYDFGLGQGGNILDFVMAYYHKNLSGALETLEELFNGKGGGRVRKKIIPPKNNLNSTEGGIKLLHTQRLEHKALLDYLLGRKITLGVAKEYLKQVHFTSNGKNYFALGFQNDNGGWEVRNKYFQGAIAPKDITVLKGNNPESYLRIFEGFMDFLSYLVIKNNSSFEGTIIVLNSLSLLGKLEAHLRKNSYKAIITFLDNDKAGKEGCRKIATYTKAPLYHRESFYAEFKDLNAYLQQ